VATPRRLTPGRRPGVLCIALLVGCTASEAPKVRTPPAIVFDWLRNGNRDIYRATLDGTDTVRLTSDPGDDQHPSARAGSVVFTSYRDGNGELYMVSSTGGAERRLTTTPANETQPALSPDGRHIAYLSDVSGVPKLWLCAADGTNPAPLTAGFGFAGSIEASPSWAPSGDRLVFVSTAHGHAGLFVLTLGAGTPLALVDDSSTAVEPSWSPDGALVAFASTRAGGGATNIYTVNVATHEIRQQTHGSETDGQPAALPDGRIVYVSWVGGTPRLRWVDPATQAVGNVSPGPGAAQHPASIY
jgi:Tol biopolymer transport system component